MAEYIDRQAAIDDILKHKNSVIEGCKASSYTKQIYGMANDHVCELINILPSADVAPVVRCKYCHFFEQDHWETVNGVPLIVAHNICTRWGKGCQTAEDGFCFMAIRSKGARMDGEQGV